MKTCSKCKRKYKQSTSYCPPCHNEYQKGWYKKNPQSTNKSCKRRREEIRKLIIDTKNIPCMDCGIKYQYFIMDFDHVRGVKRFNLSVASNKLRSLEIVKEEIAKCDVVCANCHRARTFHKQFSE